MGADAQIHLFDYERYRREVVPALIGLLRTGQPETWLDQLIEPTDGNAIHPFQDEWTGTLLPYVRPLTLDPPQRRARPAAGPAGCKCVRQARLPGVGNDRCRHGDSRPRTVELDRV
jgi:hypothetical protein